MTKAFGIIIVIIGIIVAFQFMPMFMDAVHDTVTDEESQASVDVGTYGAATSSTVVLILGLYEDDLGYVGTMTSNVTTDVPVASSYASATDTLTVTGLTAGCNRTLTIPYDYDATSEYTGFGSMAVLAPMIMILFIIGAGVYQWMGKRM